MVTRLQTVLTFGLLMASFLCGPTNSLLAADPRLPEGWQQMAPVEFAAALRQIVFVDDNFDDLPFEEHKGATERGKELFLQVDLSAPAIDYPTVEVLHWLCRYELSRVESDNAAAQLLTREDDWAGRPFSELRAKLAMLLRLKVEKVALVGEGRRWAAAGGTLEQIPAEDLKFDEVRQFFTDATFIKGAFTVEWNTLVIPPETGNYRFHLSPININAGVNQDPFKYKMTIALDNFEILESAPDPDSYVDDPEYAGDPDFPEWKSRSQVTHLTANQAIPLKVTAIVEATKDLPASALHAMLYWEDPSGTKTLVPNSALRVPGDDFPGVRATYRWKDENGVERTLTRIEQSIDVAWSSPNIPLPEDLTFSREAANAMWGVISAPEFTASLLGPPVKMHPLFKDPDSAAAGLTTKRRGDFLEILKQNPALMDPLDLKSMVRVYQAFRFGNADKALDAFGAWSARHADYVGEIFTDNVFQGDERLACATLAVNLTQQLPGEIDRLESEYLELPDGRCSLPVAYVLGCSYLGQKKHADWIAILDAKLANQSLTGDKRVNWLLARANATELTESSAMHYPKNYYVPHLDPRNGTLYLTHAMEAAESPEVKARVAKEIVIRHTFFHEFNEAKELLQPLANSLAEPSKSHLNRWITQMDRLIAVDEQDLVDQAAQAKETHRKNIEARRELASQKGDAAEVARYDAILNDLAQQQ